MRYGGLKKMLTGSRRSFAIDDWLKSGVSVAKSRSYEGFFPEDNLRLSESDNVMESHRLIDERLWRGLGFFPLNEVELDGENFQTKNLLFRHLSASSENAINESRIRYYQERFTSELVDSLRQESVEPGVVGRADQIVNNCLKANSLATIAWLSDLFLSHFSNPNLAADLLLLAGRVPFAVANPTGITMALSGLSHKSPAVQEAAIRAFENWASPECLQILRNVHIESKWLSDYLEDVKRDLEVICGEVS